MILYISRLINLEISELKLVRLETFIINLALFTNNDSSHPDLNLED